MLCRIVVIYLLNCLSDDRGKILFLLFENDAKIVIWTLLAPLFSFLTPHPLSNSMRGLILLVCLLNSLALGNSLADLGSSAQTVALNILFMLAKLLVIAVFRKSPARRCAYVGVDRPPPRPRPGPCARVGWVFCPHGVSFFFCPGPLSVPIYIQERSKPQMRSLAEIPAPKRYTVTPPCWTLSRTAIAHRHLSC
jgi:hypothetical protein